jgi:hypothetical protein
MQSDLPLSNPANRVIGKGDAHTAIAKRLFAAMPGGTEKSRHEDGKTDTSVESFKLHLEKMKGEETVTKLATAVWGALFALPVRLIEDPVVMKDLESTRSGLLVATELFSWVQKTASRNTNNIRDPTALFASASGAKVD